MHRKNSKSALSLLCCTHRKHRKQDRKHPNSALHRGCCTHRSRSKQDRRAPGTSGLVQRADGNGQEDVEENERAQDHEDAEEKHRNPPVLLNPTVRRNTIPHHHVPVFAR